MLNVNHEYRSKETQDMMDEAAAADESVYKMQAELKKSNETRQ
jgi:hypothetical protein